MSKKQSAALERKKFFSDPILISMIAVLLVFWRCLFCIRFSCCWWTVFLRRGR